MTTGPVQAGQRSRGGGRLAAAVLIVVLAGCSTSPRRDVVGSIPDDYRANHPITIDEQLATMDIPVGFDTARLSSPIKGNISAFAQRFRASGSSVMAIVVPRGSPNEVVATGVSHQIHDVLVGAGVRRDSVDFRSYDAGSGESGAPIRLAYNRIAAHVDGCGTWPDRLDKDFNNRNFKNFGCATQANLAAMVDNPLDLMYPRATAPADAERRSAVLEKYRQGEEYSAKQKLERGQVAQGVGD